MNGSGVVHGKIDLSAIEHFPECHRWKFSLLNFSEIVGQPMEYCPTSALLPPEMTTASIEGSTILAKPFLDWWSYGLVALAVLTGETIHCVDTYECQAVHPGEDICTVESLSTIPGAVSWNNEFAASVQNIKACCCRELIGNLLLSGPKSRKHPRYVLDRMRSMDRSSDIALLTQSVTTVHKHVAFSV